MAMAYSHSVDDIQNYAMIFFQMSSCLYQPFTEKVDDGNIFQIRLTPMSSLTNDEPAVSNKRTKEKKDFYGEVLRVDHGNLHIKLETRLKHVGNGFLYHVQFVQNRVPFQMSHFALDFIKKRELCRFIFPIEPFGESVAGRYDQ